MQHTTYKMLNPFNTDSEDLAESERFIDHTIKKEKSNYSYIPICLYILQIATLLIGSINDNTTNGFIYSSFTLQRWLIIFSIYNMCGLISIYQFNQHTPDNRIYFIFYKFIKIIFIIIGFLILFTYNTINNCNFILGYGLFYTLFELIQCLINTVF